MPQQPLERVGEDSELQYLLDAITKASLEKDHAERLRVLVKDLWPVLVEEGEPGLKAALQEKAGGPLRALEDMSQAWDSGSKR